MKRFPLATFFAVGLSWALGLAQPGLVAAGPYQAILTSQHLHLSPDYDGGWNVHLYDFDNDVDYDPDSTMIYVDPAARQVQPAGATWSFIGAGAGSPYFRTPQSPAGGLVSFSVATEETFPGTFTPYVESDPRVPPLSAGWMKFQLQAIRGPGDFALWQQSGNTLTSVWVASSDGLGPSDTAILPEGGHVHYYAGFTQPGYYELDFVGSARLGSTVSTSPVTTFHVAVAPPVGVASLGSRETRVFDPLNMASVLADAGDGLFTPIDLEYGAECQLYAADVLTGKVWQYDLAGNATLLAGRAQGLTSPSGLAVAANGDVLVANYLTNTIQRINPQGEVTLVADAADGLDGPFGLALDQAGNLFVANLDAKQILKINPAGVASVFADASDGLLTPLGVSVDKTGNVFVADALKSNILKFTGGGVGSIFADAADGLFTPTGLGFDLRGNLVVSDYLSNKMWSFTPGGAGSLMADAGDGLNQPFGVAVYNPRLLPGGGGALAVPEPSAAGLAALGLLGLLGLARKNRA